ncbi:dynein regulatory complex protein 10 isoform X1 [Cynoglossus semilaevis]|uniref:Dynein regulatory complex protein 10 n=2 Tax=Cynoglossus semilaevis TaxID=244447 RepID=A0A3P8W774_CYNSE|nr:dynein regulatory complex protein 10 isoform X1 [Cynoglossus semilaevis]
MPYFNCAIRLLHSMSAKGTTVVAATKANTKLVDIIKKNDLPQKKLLSVEAQRISRILQNCINQIKIVATLPALLSSCGDSVDLDEKLMRDLKKHQLLSEKLEREILENDNQESGEDIEVKKRARVQLEKDVKNSVRDLLRFLRSYPDDLLFLRAEQYTGENEGKLIKGLQKFHSNTVDKLLMGLDEESTMVLHKLAFPSTADDLEVLASREKEVATAKKQIDEKIAEKNTEMKILEQVTFTALRADKKFQPQVTTSTTQARLQQEIEQMKMKLNNLVLENRQAERILQEENEKVESEIEYLLQKFDSNMKEIQADLEINEIDYRREEDELRSLEKPFHALEEEYNQIVEKHRLAEHQRVKEMQELELKTKAAILAQSWWRGYKTRKALKNKGKSKKAKKGKGKKK